MIRAGNIALHKQLGKLSVGLAMGILISGIWVPLSTYARSEDATIVMANIVNIVSFIVLFGFVLYHYKRIAIHKRFIIYASLSMLIPALGRLTKGLGINEFLSLFFLIVLIFIPLI